MKEFKVQFECLGENTEKYITSLVPIEKQENRKSIKHKIRLINNARFMASSLSSLVDNLAEVLHNSKCKDFWSSLE